MENQTLHFRHMLLFYFHKGKNAHQAYEKLRKVYSDSAPEELECERWFTKFRAGDFDLHDIPRSGRPIKVEEDKTL